MINIDFDLEREWKKYEIWKQHESWKKKEMNNAEIVAEMKKQTQIKIIKTRDVYSELYYYTVSAAKKNPKKITKAEMQFLLFNHKSDVHVLSNRILSDNYEDSDVTYLLDCLDQITKIAKKLK